MIQEQAKSHGKVVTFSKSSKTQGAKFSIFKTIDKSTKNEDKPDDLKKELEASIRELIPYIHVVTEALSSWVDSLRHKNRT